MSLIIITHTHTKMSFQKPLKFTTSANSFISVLEQHHQQQQVQQQEPQKQQQEQQQCVMDSNEFRPSNQSIFERWEKLECDEIHVSKVGGKIIAHISNPYSLNEQILIPPYHVQKISHNKCEKRTHDSTDDSPAADASNTSWSYTDDDTPINQTLGFQRTEKQKLAEDNAQKKFKCDKCMFSTSNMLHLHRHNVVHSTIKNYSCDSCPYITTRKASLKRHMSVHSISRLYSCPTCSFSSNDKSHLNRHTLIHVDSKRYSCESCAFQTKYSWVLKKHNIKRHAQSQNTFFNIRQTIRENGNIKPNQQEMHHKHQLQSTASDQTPAPQHQHQRQASLLHSPSLLSPF